MLTSRERKILTVLSHGALSFAELLRLTGTSRRTLYRDLELLTASLPNGLTIRTDERGWWLEGDATALLAGPTLDWKASERLYGEIVLLSTDRASLSGICESFDISSPTASSDLRKIEKELVVHGLQLYRGKQGLQLSGDEETIRKLIAASLSEQVTVLELLSGDFAQNKFLNLLDTNLVKQAVAAFELCQLPDISDKRRSQLEFFFIASLTRLSAGHHVAASSRRPSQKALTYVSQLVARLPATKDFDQAEIQYLAGCYDVLYFGFGFGEQLLFMESFDADFSYKIRKLIDRTSELTGIPFGKDDRLYSLLYAHLKGTDILPSLFADKDNAFVAQIRADNLELYQTVSQTLRTVFERDFSSKENALVSLHFAATLERSNLVLPLRAALVTSRGRISCEFLISNLRKNFPFLQKIEILQLSQKLDNSLYDAIFTTEENLPYIYVDRVLTQHSLDEMRRRLRRIQQKARPIKTLNPQENFLDLNQLFSLSNQLLTDFTISHVQAEVGLEAVIEKITVALELPEVAELLLARFAETHLAIPDTRLALLHGVHPAVKKPLFKIFDCFKPIEVVGMDRQPLAVSRFLVLLAPTDIDEASSYLLGALSSSIIENRLYTVIYNSGNREIIEELLRQIVAEAIKKYGE